MPPHFFSISAKVASMLAALVTSQGSMILAPIELASGVTGEVHHVDCGYHVVGMLAPESAQQISELLNGANLVK